MMRFSFSDSMLDLARLQAPLRQDDCGGYVSFEGWVRDHNEGLAVTRLEYEAFEALGIKEGERIIAEACERFGLRHALCAHRVGSLAIGDVAVWVGVSAPHRDEAFRACRYIIDEVKHRLPVWKKEHYVNGDSGWVNCERCATPPSDTAHSHTHTHSHSHSQQHAAHGDQGAGGIARVDYSRQTILREVGPHGQRQLAERRVSIVGAGGLGVPVMQYLAGAGVGHLHIIDGDRLEASNLHRQTLYALADCGKPKAELAAARLRALNPQIHVAATITRLDVGNAESLLRGADLVLDCSDNFATKFLLNDVAMLLGTPIIFASVYQFEGQLQVVRPRQRSSCLRCIWPDATRDGLVGNCAEAGVLGPVPGVFGSLQALEALKLLLDMPGQLHDELLMFDLTSCTINRTRAHRNAGCLGTACLPCGDALAAARAAAAGRSTVADIELSFASLDAAAAAGFTLIDIRDADEVSKQPTPAREARHVPMAQLLAATELPQVPKCLLVCARGARSLATATELRSRGMRNVYSLRGGVSAL